MVYNNKFLVKHCEEKHIELIEDYTNIKVSREHKIKGKCVNKDCVNIFDKSFRQMVEAGAYCHGCSVENGKRKHKLLCKYNFSYLKTFCNDNKIILNRNYECEFINRDTLIEGICINEKCEQTFSRTFRELVKFNGFCFDCCKEEGKQKIIKTNLQRFGVENPMKNKEFKEKVNKIILEKYGVKHISQSAIIKEKKKQTCLANFGTEYSLQSEIVKNKGKQTNLLKYGVENPQQNQDVKNKTYETNLKKYGAKHYFQTEECKQTIIKTCMEKYGVPHHSQNAEVANLILKHTFSTKQYTLPSGNIINYQGYENFALDELLKIEKINEEDIITDRKEVPEIWYFDKNNKKRRHYVDFFIKSQNRCIEVKSTWTNQEKNNVFEKQKAGIELGYSYEIWIYDSKGNKVEQY